MKNFLSLAIFSIKENLKTKLYLIISIFSVILIFIGLLLTGLSGFEQPQRVLVNTGIAMIELFCLIIIITNSVSIFLQDIETKSIYLILSKSVSRTKYIISKYFGLLLFTIINILIMSVIHIILLRISKWHIPNGYFLTLLTIFLKIGIISSVAILTAVSMTSQAVSVITSLLLWIAGHFVSELIFITKRIQILPLRVLIKIICYFIPNFQYLNIKDYFDTPYFLANFNVLFGIGYWLLYSFIVVTIACVIFSEKNL